jgi:hypothetical protein
MLKSSMKIFMARVAGIIGSKTYGVAKKTHLYAVKVMARRS